MPLDVANRLLNTLPLSLSGQVSSSLFSHLASQKPGRYLALEQPGCPVIDSRNPSANIQHCLSERACGHYVDLGSTKLIAKGDVAVRGCVEPVCYTESGIRLSDGSVINTDAVIWCTGFANHDARATTLELLSAGDPHIRTEIAFLGQMISHHG